MISYLVQTRSVAALLALLTVALLITAGCRNKAEAPKPLVASELAGDFVGNAACADCHQEEFRAHHGSRHDTTLRQADRKSLGPQAPPLGVIPLAGYVFAEQNGQFMLSRSLPTERTQRLDYVLGSGKLGMTFVSIFDATTMMETHMSYFPPFHLWQVTPGQEVVVPDDDLFGRKPDTENARRCLGCHSTTVSQNDLRLNSRFFGVGCEACHGPGRKHIEAISAGNIKESQMDKIGRWKGSRINDLCGKCHRKAQDIDPTNIGAEQTQRFQPYALNRSACRTADGEPLSCLRCHDPHTNVSTDLKKYEADCLQCHAAKLTITAQSNARQSKVCPVNATSGCISCHMRPMKAFIKTFVPATMVDHLISKPKSHP